MNLYLPNVFPFVQHDGWILYELQRMRERERLYPRDPYGIQIDVSVFLEGFFFLMNKYLLL